MTFYNKFVTILIKRRYILKINNECARKILFEVEKIPYSETLTIIEFYKRISEFSIEDVLNIVTNFNKEHYLVVVDNVSYDVNYFISENKIKCLTESRYKTLDLIKNDEVWNIIKEKIDNFDETSIYTLFDIDNKIMSVEHNRLFELPYDLLLLSSRW